MRAWCSTEASDEHPYRGFAARSAQNASVVAISAMGMHTVTHICSVECPECGRGAHLAVGNGDSHAFLRRRALRMRAWRSSSDWAGQQLSRFAMMGVQNAGVATTPSLGRVTVPGAAFTRVFTCRTHIQLIGFVNSTLAYKCYVYTYFHVQNAHLRIEQLTD